MAATIPQKTNRVLKIILVVMLLILVRVWQVSVGQHTQRQEEARRFQTRVVPVKPERGVIEDRFGQTLAQNQIQYNAAITYAPIREVPRIKRERKVKRFFRKEYIENLAQLLGKELDMDPTRVEDMIHSKAALFPNIPYVIKANILDEQYYRLKMLEREWPGLTAERGARRAYPQGKVAAEVIGYVGPISREEYLRVAFEMGTLRGYLEGYERGEPVVLPKGVGSYDEAKSRLEALLERSYSLRDAVGKGGVEKTCDEVLRGFCGRALYQQDIYGTYRGALPGGKAPQHGETITLALSLEMQKTAEELLAQTERFRDGRSHQFDFTDRVYAGLKQPWIKGGAIVVIDPNTGEILTLASYPRSDANDFIPTQDPDAEGTRISNILRWFETERHLGEIWDGRRPLERENYDPVQKIFAEEARPLTLETYLELALSKEGKAKKGLAKVKNLETACRLQHLFTEAAAGQDARALINGLYSRGSDLPLPVDPLPLNKELKKALDPYLAAAPTNYEKLLILDLCKMLVDAERFSPELLEAVGQLSLEEYREACRSAAILEGALYSIAKGLFHDHQFVGWKRDNQKAFLKGKREREKELGTYERPYLDYLDAEELEQFTAFWSQVKSASIALLIKGDDASIEIDSTFAPFAEHLLALSAELKGGAHAAEKWHSAYQHLSHQLRPLSFSLSCEFLETHRPFSELNRPLWGHYRYLRGKPGFQTERDLAAAFYPRYGFGYARSHAYRQATAQGSVFKFVPAFEVLMQRYDKLQSQGQKGPLNPLTIVDDVHKVPGTQNQWNVGFTTSGKAISQRYKGGKLLRTHRRHVGKIDLARAFETSSNSYFGILASDCIADPEDLNRAARSLSYGAQTGIELPGEFSGRLPDDLSFNKTGLYTYVDGQHTLVVTPLQTAVMLSALVNGGKVFKPQIFKGKGEVRRQLEIPDTVRKELLEGMRRVVQGEQGGARPSVVRSYQEAPWILQDYRTLHKQLVGKTSTAEVVETVDLDPYTGTNTYNHLWFAGVSFQPEEIHTTPSGVTFGKPELVVIVYLKYGDYGREAAPLAAQMIKKWRELQESRKVDDMIENP